MKTGYQQHSKFKRSNVWANLKKIETDRRRGYWQLVNLTLFLKFIVRFATFKIMFERHISLTRT